MFIHCFGAGGGRPPDLQQYLQRSSSGDHIVWIGDLGGDPQVME